jgi:hypothetical protein
MLGINPPAINRGSSATGNSRAAPSFPLRIGRHFGFVGPHPQRAERIALEPCPAMLMITSSPAPESWRQPALLTDCAIGYYSGMRYLAAFMASSVAGISAATRFDRSAFAVVIVGATTARCRLSSASDARAKCDHLQRLQLVANGCRSPRNLLRVRDLNFLRFLAWQTFHRAGECAHYDFLFFVCQFQDFDESFSNCRIRVLRLPVENAVNRRPIHLQFQPMHWLQLSADTLGNSWCIQA